MIDINGGYDYSFFVLFQRRYDVHIVSTANEYASVVRADIKAGC